MPKVENTQGPKKGTPVSPIVGGIVAGGTAFLGWLLLRRRHALASKPGEATLVPSTAPGQPEIS